MSASKTRWRSCDGRAVSIYMTLYVVMTTGWITSCIILTEKYTTRWPKGWVSASRLVECRSSCPFLAVCYYLIIFRPTSFKLESLTQILAAHDASRDSSGVYLWQAYEDHRRRLWPNSKPTPETAFGDIYEYDRVGWWPRYRCLIKQTYTKTCFLACIDWSTGFILPRSIYWKQW